MTCCAKIIAVPGDVIMADSTQLTVFHFEDDRPNFETLGKENGATHWDENVLMESLGYESASSFVKALTRAKQACLSLGIQCEDHFVRLDNGKHAITRFGCYLVAMNGDPRKPQVAAAQAYFAALAETFQSSLEHAEAIDRILIRDEVTDGQKSLASAAKSHGVCNYAFFQNKGYLGMYNMSLERLRQYKGLGSKDKLIDRMGKAELAAHLFRVTQTTEKIENENIRGQPRLEQAAFDVGQKVRRTMEELSGKSPENLPVAEAITKVKQKLMGTPKRLDRIEQHDGGD
jgi:DNA-damage-inducible protein D